MLRMKHGAIALSLLAGLVVANTVWEVSGGYELADWCDQATCSWTGSSADWHTGIDGDCGVGF